MDSNDFRATPQTKRVLVTGATGFIGKALLRRLAKGNFDIIACYRTKKTYEKNKISSSNITYFNLDLTNRDDFKKITQRVDVVIHLAAQVFKSDTENLFEDFLNNNVLGTYNLLEFCKGKNVGRIIYISSKYVYGEPEIEKVDETYPAQPSGTFFYYGMGKLMCEHLCIRHSHDFDIKLIILRLSPVFGEEQREWYLIPRLIKKVRNKQNLVLYGDGSNVMEYLYVDDCVEAIIKSLDTPHDGIYNIGPGESLTFRGVIDSILKVYSPDQSITVHYDSGQKPGEKGFILDIRRAEEKLGFKPAYTFEDGLRKVGIHDAKQ